jgi:hypothetical protein
MARRGFTLLETLIAVGLMVAIGALAVPAVWGRTESARLDAAGRQAAAMIVRCREESQRRGEPLALSFSDAGGAWLVMERVSGAGARERVGRGEERASAREAPGAWGGAAEAGPAPADAGVMVEVDREPLPDGVVVLVEKPASGPEGGAALAGVEAPAPRGAPVAREGNLRLVVFMPDGSAVMPRAFYVRSAPASARALEVVAHRWSGGAEVRELDLSAETEGGGAEECGAPPPPGAADGGSPS